MLDKNEIIISPKMIFDVIRKNLIFILITVVAFATVTFVYTKVFIPKKYTSTMSLYVETTSGNQSENVGVVQEINETTLARRLVATYIGMLDKNVFYQTLSEKLDGDYTAAQLSSMISYAKDDVDSTEIFQVSVVSKSPTESKRIADAFAEAAPDRIKDLKSNATLKVADPGQVPRNQSYPNATRNVIIAVLIALLVSLLIAFIRHFADKKIKYSEEMTEIYDIPVLAAIPNFNTYINRKNTNDKNKTTEG